LDGCPEKDNDQDGLPDALDECPSRKGPESKKGCPDRFATIIVRANSIALRRPIQFRGKSAELHRRSRGVLREIVIALNKYPKLKLRIEGYASSKSSETANQRLARARASAVRAVLMSKGIARSRLDVDGFAVDTSTDGATPQERIEIHIDSE
jgi:outer membrane protein OmpA-like peptidoglycan-associated protein